MTRVDVQKVADEAELGGFHWNVLFWCSLIVLLDGYDLAVVGVALPAIIRDMKVDPAIAGTMASSALFGMAFGAMFLGALADRFGRRAMIALCTFLFSAFTGVAGLVNDPISFCVLRFIAGLGLGGVLPNLTAAMTEYMPKKSRSLLTTLMFCGYGIGGLIAALTGKQLLEAFGWQSLFLVAGVPVLLVPLILKLMPESMPVLIARNDQVGLRKIVTSIAPRTVIPADAQLVVPEAAAPGEAAPLAALFQNGRGFSTIMFWVAFFTGLFMMYALSAWLTSLMALAGYSLGSALTFTIVFQLGSIAGALSGGWFGDRFNAKWVLAIMWGVGAVALAAMGFKMPQPLLFLTVAIVGATTAGTQAVAYAYIGQFYPLSMRSTGIGMASGMGRAGGIAAPILIGLIVSLKLPIEQNFFVIALAGVVGAVAIALVNHGLSASEADKKAPAVAQRATA